jgi:hypothetical protein
VNLDRLPLFLQSQCKKSFGHYCKEALIEVHGITCKRNLFQSSSMFQILVKLINKIEYSTHYFGVLFWYWKSFSDWMIVETLRMFFCSGPEVGVNFQLCPSACVSESSALRIDHCLVVYRQLYSGGSVPYLYSAPPTLLLQERIPYGEVPLLYELMFFSPKCIIAIQKKKSICSQWDSEGWM